MKKYSTLFLLILFSIIAFHAAAQKLPNIQSVSQLLPAGTRIDGKLQEWMDLLKAYNTATQLEYTLANDDKNLYLAIRSKDITTTAKILAGGVSLILNTNNGPMITFPATNSAYSWNEAGISQNFRLLSDSVAIQNAIRQLKEIKVSGLKGIADGNLSVFNEYSIRTKMLYAGKTLICELSVPVNLIGLLTDNFSYYIRLNGVPVPPIPPGVRVPPPPPPVLVAGPRKRPAPGSYVNGNEIDFPTYFTGKYSLAKGVIGE